jgi:hypothetical protein
MNALFKLFSLPADKMNEIAAETGSIVAGSAPLCALVGGRWEPNDLDIWYHDAFNVKGGASYDKLNNTIKSYTEFLAENGYVLDTDRKKGDSYMYGDSKSSFGKVVKRVYKFYRTDGLHKSVQLIITRIPVRDAIKEFDLSCCITWWEPKTGESDEKLMTHDPDMTLAGKMYSLSDDVSDREKLRILKYRAREFTLVKRPSA